MYTVLPINSVYFNLFKTNYNVDKNNLKEVFDKFIVLGFNIILNWLNIKFLPNLNKKTLVCLKVLLPLSL
jgi:hypothetical protein